MRDDELAARGLGRCGLCGLKPRSSLKADRCELLLPDPWQDAPPHLLAVLVVAAEDSLFADDSNYLQGRPDRHYESCRGGVHIDEPADKEQRFERVDGVS